MRRVPNRTLLAAVIAAFAGCAQDGPGAGGGNGAPPNTVVGRVYATCHQLPADTDVPTDLTSTTIQAVISDTSATGFHISPGIGLADGTFTITDVPDGTEYMLQLGSTYYVTDQQVIDAHSERSDRCTPAPTSADASTPVTFSLSNMTPFSPGPNPSDRLELDSFALAARTFVETTDLQLGNATTPTVGTIDWKGEPLLDAAAGDDLLIFHRRSDNVIDPATHRVRKITHLVDLFDATGLSLKNGVPAMISGAFQPAIPNRTASFSIDRAAFDTGYAGTTAPTSLTIAIIAHPLAYTSFGAVLARFDLSDVSRSASLVQTITSYPYSDPFPDTWKRSLVVTYDRRRKFGLGGTLQVVPFSGEVEPLLALPPPTGIRIAGADFDAGGKIAFDGHTPLVVSWDPVPGAQVYELGLSGDGAGIAFITANTSLSIPGRLVANGLLTSGSFYQLELSAIQTPSDYRAGHLLPLGVPSQSSSVPSGRFRFTTDCGDGVVQHLEEECDTGGETATCNIDCTKPACGDGLRNAAAGEECDTGTESATCDADCTLPVCGDGHVNRTLEDCDDGNAADDGNGCSADCKFNNVCGNGIIERAVEQCDPGTATDTPTCDSDCTTVLCGDGHVNHAAGEECDNGASFDPHCTFNCKLQ
jgi:cysteine-rich repeat protein